MNPRIPSHVITSKDGVNAVKSFLEHHGCVFQEVAQQNDYRKDGYVDIGERGAFTFLCAALQIRSGTSHRTRKGDYLITVESHANTWRRSTVPVFGLVYDPDDGLIRWVDLLGIFAPIQNSWTGQFQYLLVRSLMSSACEERSEPR